MAERKTIIPAYLQKGDTIGIVCPAGFMPREKADTCIATLQQWGYKVKVGNTLGGKSKNYFSGTDDERLKDIQQMLDDRDVKAILCGRGGYGMSRIIDRISFDHFRREPKWIVGFSDITVLHSHIYSNYRIASLHAPMAAAFNDGGYKNKYIASLKDALAGKKANYVVKPHRFNRAGLVKAELVGGNLSLLAHLTGTRSGLNTRGRILFLEDVGEYLYNIDRMLQQLKRAGKLDGLAGLIVGGFSDLKDTTRPYGKKVHDIIKEAVEEYNYPVCFGFPVSHEKENMALKIGAEYSLKVSARTVALKES